MKITTFRSFVTNTSNGSKELQALAVLLDTEHNLISGSLAKGFARPYQVTLHYNYTEIRGCHKPLQ